MRCWEEEERLTVRVAMIGTVRRCEAVEAPPASGVWGAAGGSGCTRSDEVLALGEEEEGAELGWLLFVLVSWMLVGGEGGEGGGRRERQRAGLRADASGWGRVGRRLRDTEEENEGREISSVHQLLCHWSSYDRWGSSPDCVAAAIGWICYPGNKELLRGFVGLHTTWQRFMNIQKES